ncbi:MAG: IS110 family transposase [Acidimicrobiales bacterium]
MSMVCGLDLHRGQITFDALEVESGEVWRGRLWQPDRARFRRWLTEELAPRAKGGPVALAVEGCTGWRYVAEEIIAAGFEAHVAEPADTQAARGRKKHAKTDRSDARLMRDLLQAGDLPESWIPPEAVLEWRERVRLYKTLLDQRRMWIQRIHAELFQHGVSLPEAQITSTETRNWLASDTVQLSEAARQRIEAGHQIIDATDAVRLPLRADLERFGRRQPACKVLAAEHYGIGPLTAVVVWAERALFEAGMAASRVTSPDRAYYQAVKQRHDGKIAAISMARKLARRCYHTLRQMDPEVVYAMPAKSNWRHGG